MPQMVMAEMDSGIPEKSVKQKSKTQVSSPEQKQETVETVIRSDFRETAFFYPALRTDSTGSAEFTFTVPDALTEWKMMLLAHTSDLKTGLKEYRFKAYKEIMVMPNTPRFVRQKDKLEFTARVINRSDSIQDITVNVKFFDPISKSDLNLFLTRMTTRKHLTLMPGESRKVSWYIRIPEEVSLLAYRIEASSKTFSDGEERIIPVLSNRELVTETLPVWVKGKTDKTFVFKDFVTKSSEEGTGNFIYSVEFTSNPTWFAIQALPYLNEPLHESAGTVFNVFYTNTLSAWIMNSSPDIKKVVDSWKRKSPEAFWSQLKKDPELKNVILSETPWVLEAEDETEQKRRIALLFDLNNLSNNRQVSMDKLRRMQLPSGAWSWFSGMKEDRFTTQKILSGFARLIDKGIIDFDEAMIKSMVTRGVYYLDRKIREDYKKLKEIKNVDLGKFHISNVQIRYLYLRSLLNDRVPMKEDTREAYRYYLDQTARYKLKFTNYLQALSAVILYENQKEDEAEAVLRSLKERSLKDSNGGIYWRRQNGWQWYKAPVETQAAIMEAFDRLDFNKEMLDGMKVWLLEQKRTQRWETVSATAEAVHALLMTGDKTLLEENRIAEVKVGGEPLNAASAEPGTGYIKRTWHGKEIVPSLGNIEVKNHNDHMAWGAAYWQYFRDMDKVAASGKGLRVEKYLLKENPSGGTKLVNGEGEKFKVGDKVFIRLVISNDRYMEFVSLKDVRATGMEVADQLSGYDYGSGLGYYKNNKDASTTFYFRYLPKGTFVIEYPVFLTQKGVFPTGIATIQSLYAPEFSGHSKGFKIEVE
jgi:uncharacterized protein YfaS (alpha-2-macroglobulin family)